MEGDLADLRQTRIIATILLCLALLITACSNQGSTPPADNNDQPTGQTGSTSDSGNDEPKELVVYTAHPPDTHEPLLQKFEDETGIKVTVVYAGTGELFQKIQAEAANPQADVMFGGGAESHEANKEFLEPYRPNGADQLAPGAMAADNTWTGFTALPMVIMYNTELVSPEEVPQSWADLADPKWRGKIAMPDPAKSGSAYTSLVTMLEAAGRGDAAWDLVKDIIANTAILGSSTAAPKGVNDGEYALAITHEEGGAKYKAAGGPVDFVYPSEGTSAVPDATAILKGAKHPNNAKLFVDWTIKKETQEQIVATLKRRSVRLDVNPADGLPPTSEIKLVDYDMDFASGEREAILDRWKDIVTE